MNENPYRAQLAKAKDIYCISLWKTEYKYISLNGFICRTLVLSIVFIPVGKSHHCLLVHFTSYSYIH